MKAVINKGDLVGQMLEGVVAAYNGKVKKLESVNGLVCKNIPEGKVGLLIGGGSGHEPLFSGFMGKNLVDGVAVGNIFAAPNPKIIMETTKAVDKGKGVFILLW